MVKENAERPRMRQEADTEYRHIVASTKSISGDLSPAEKIKAKFGQRLEVVSDDGFRVKFREPRAQHEERVRMLSESRAKALGDVASPVEGQEYNRTTRKESFGGKLSLDQYAERLPEHDPVSETPTEGGLEADQ